MASTPTEQHRGRAERIRTEMGGLDKVERLRQRGRSTVRERIAALVDPDSFEEHGTFAFSKRESDRDETPGDGKIGGFATIDGRPVAIYGDDITVRQGSSALVGMRKTRRLEHLAARAGCPIIDLGETGGARIPDILGAVGITGAQMSPEKGNRQHRTPSATVIVGKSFGGSSIASARGDFTIQVRGSCLAITSPRVFEVAIGEQIGFEELGGVDVHAEYTGQIDLDVDSEPAAWVALRRWLSYLPSNAWQPAPRAEPVPPAGADPVGDVVDAESWFELRPRVGRSLRTGLARIDGWPVGMLASDPTVDGGRIDAHGFEKATRLLVLCDSFDLPVISLIDSGGVAPDDGTGQERVLYRFTKWRQALALARCPRLAVVTGRADGVAFASLLHSGWAPDGAYAWPAAELGLAGGHAPRAAYEAAGVLGLDEVIEPAETRRTLIRTLDRLAHRAAPDPSERRLSYWSTC